MPEVIIVGSGLAGMSAATRLLEQGFDITLYEQNNFLGGKLGAHRDSHSTRPARALLPHVPELVQ